MNWSGQQDKALMEVSDWMDDPDRPTFYLAGYAGTGKTTLARHFAENTNGLVLFAAFTGKAASVLAAKGCEGARTLHSILYEVGEADRSKLRELEQRLRTILAMKPVDDTHRVSLLRQADEIENKIKLERKRTAGPRFSLNSESTLKEAELLILDECSMVDNKLAEDVLSFNKKVLVLGDPAQLPPVRGTGYFTSRRPDVLLTEIHRQARDNPIIRAATALREHRPIPFGDWGAVRHLSKNEIDKYEFIPNRVKDGSQVLCGFNKSRRGINITVRRSMGNHSRYPVNGEQLVVLRNDRELGVLNGVLCTASGDAEPDMDDDCHMIRLDYEGHIVPTTPMDRVPFDIYLKPELEKHYSPGMHPHLLQCDWGYALTVHKSQGSEWNDVTLYDDGFGSRQQGLRWKWLYTGATRAMDRLTIIS